MRRQRKPCRQCGSDRKNKPKELHEDMQRQTLSVWYITYKIESPAAQAKPDTRSRTSKNQNNSEQNRVHFQGNAETFLAEAAHVIGFDSWTIELSARWSSWTHAGQSITWMDTGRLGSDTQKIMARNKQME